MSAPIRPSGDAFLAELTDLRRRLTDLERAARMPNTSQRGGTFELLDDQGRPVFYFGTFTRGASPPSYGVQGVIPGGAGAGSSPTVLEIDDDGLEAPYLDLPYAKASDFVPVTAGAFANIWVGHAALIVARAVAVRLTIGVDAATTGEVRIVAGGIASAVVNCPGGAFTNPDYAMLLPANSIGTGPLTVEVQARRTAGAGNVNVYPPIVMAQAGNDGTNATASGL